MLKTCQLDISHIFGPEKHRLYTNDVIVRVTWLLRVTLFKQEIRINSDFLLTISLHG